MQSDGASSDLTLTKVGTNFGSPDHYFEKARLAPGNQGDKKAFSYFVIGGSKFLYASAVRVALLKVVATMSASADVLALASLEVDLNTVEEGATVTVKWRGKPVFIRHRTDKMIADVSGPAPSDLRDVQDDASRVQNPKYLVVMGICTHLGCVPISNAGDYGGWYCPCHGSHYDGSGRIRRGPAPLNLEIPPYKITEENKLILG